MGVFILVSSCGNILVDGCLHPDSSCHPAAAGKMRQGFQGVLFPSAGVSSLWKRIGPAAAAGTSRSGCTWSRWGSRCIISGSRSPKVSDEPGQGPLLPVTEYRLFDSCQISIAACVISANIQRKPITAKMIPTFFILSSPVIFFIQLLDP